MYAVPLRLYWVLHFAPHHGVGEDIQPGHESAAVIAGVVGWGACLSGKGAFRVIPSAGAALRAEGGEQADTTDGAGLRVKYAKGSKWGRDSLLGI